MGTTVHHHLYGMGLYKIGEVGVGEGEREGEEGKRKEGKGVRERRGGGEKLRQRTPLIEFLAHLCHEVLENAKTKHILSSRPPSIPDHGRVPCHHRLLLA